MPARLTGTAGWSIPRAVAARFPGDGQHLARYARVLPVAEINSSFYRPHRAETYARWAAMTPADFRFAVKLPRSITHERRLVAAQAPLETFLGEVAGLGGRLGPLLVQLPPSLAFDPAVARDFFETLRIRHDGAVVCEPRHAAWFTPAAEALLNEYRIGRVTADPAPHAGAGLPGGWSGHDPSGRGGTVYLRLHGSPRRYWSSYSVEQMAGWARIAAALPEADHWFIFDNTASGAAIENALALLGMQQRAGSAPPG